EGVSPGQREAARALGLSSGQAMRYVILPQAVMIAMPPLTNEAIALVKLTSVGYVIGLQELLGQARQAQELTANMTPLVTGALTYLLLLLILSRLSHLVESGSKRRLPHLLI
ncbi:MAG: ABC transporter permease subunit, partial [Armatimonadota bacterium]|nr:ABC transporter permease subunit [Armatimonadota bacterium]